MSLKAVLFDLDDTLFDHRRAARAALQELRDNYPLLRTTAAAQLEAVYFQVLEEVHRRVLHGDLSVAQARVIRMQQLFAACGELLSEQAAQEVSQCFLQAYMAARRTVPGARGVLRELKARDLTVAVVSNNLTKDQEAKLAHLGLDRWIDILITSEDAGEPKPAPAVFVAALRAAGCAAAEAVLIGDSWEADIAGAHPLGIRCIWLNRNGAVCPDPSMATEIRRLVPVAPVVDLILDRIAAS